jgi:hypothetical protein
MEAPLFVGRQQDGEPSVTVDVFVIDPAAPVVTVNWTVPVLPAGIDPQLHVTDVGNTVQLSKPPVTVMVILPGVMEPEITLESDTFDAARGPLFLTLIENVTLPPDPTEAGDRLRLRESRASLGITEVVVVVTGASSTTTSRLSVSVNPAWFVTVNVTMNLPG